MEFKEYPKIHRLGKEETDGILEGECWIQEKIDGANTSIFIKDDGTIGTGSRTQEITGKSFNGFNEYVQNHEGIKKLLTIYPQYRLYGEWLCRHTIQYNELSYKQFYLYDVEAAYSTTTTGERIFLPTENVNELADCYGIKRPELFATLDGPSVDDIKSFVGKTVLGEQGEGVVVKNSNFINKFGQLCYAKLVTEKFKEDNGIVFGGNDKHSENYWEIYVMNKYITLERVQKIMHKIQPTIEKRLDFEHIPRITSTVYHDMITEEMWEIVGKVTSLNFNKLKYLCNKKVIQIYKEIITGDISVAHKNNNE